MLQTVFHAWERHLASISKDRVVRDFEWGLDWLPSNGHRPGADPARVVAGWVEQVMGNTDACFTPAPTAQYCLEPRPEGEALLRFPSARATPHHENNTVHCRYFAARTRRGRPAGRKSAVVVLPQWNADRGGHVGLCRLLAWNGMSALRLSLPYHDDRMPPELTRADYIVSSNVGRTAQVCRQAVLDSRQAIAWLHAEGYDSIGILGTSLGSCLSMLTTAHEPLVKAAAL